MNPLHQFRFELLPVPLIMWLLCWGAAIGVYLGLVWPNGSQPWWWWPQVPAIVLASLACVVACTYKHWRRVLDRSPQLELYNDCLRAKQLGDVEIHWADVHSIRTLDKIGGAQEIGMNTRNSLLILDVEGVGAVELNLDGLGVPAQHVLELIAKFRPEFTR